MAVLRVMSRKHGDNETHWDVRNPVSVERARAEFDGLMKRSALAFVIDGVGEATQIHSFDPAAQEILMVPQIRGGC